MGDPCGGGSRSTAVKIMANQMSRIRLNHAGHAGEELLPVLISGPGLWNSAFGCGWHLRPPSSAGRWCVSSQGTTGWKGWLGQTMLHFLPTSRPALVWRAARLRVPSMLSGVWELRLATGYTVVGKLAARGGRGASLGMVPSVSCPVNGSGAQPCPSMTFAYATLRKGLQLPRTNIQ
jgi:hypothetical protein